MLHRIRLAMQNNTLVKIGGEVEVDETYIGGKARNMHKGRRKVKGPGAVGKTAIQGLLQRHSGNSSKVIMKVLSNVKIPTLQANVKEYVLKGSNVYTDALTAYRGLAGEYAHEFVDHAERYVKGKVHTNGLENFWSLLKRGIRGTYVSVAPFHLFRYLDEQSFRFNERQDNDQGRFMKAINGIIGKSLKYADLIGKSNEDLQPA
jgi:transposase-like protein